MKPNLNSVILDSQNYITYLFENAHVNHIDYEKFLESYVPDTEVEKLIEYCDNNNVDIYPYLYTLNSLSDREYVAFVRYLSTYMKKCDLVADCQTINRNNLFSIVQGSIEHLVAFIVTMQYYFL
jgi:transposase